MSIHPPSLSLSVWLSERALLLWDRWLCASSSLALMTSSAACRSGCSASIPPCLWLLADVCPGTYCTQIPKLIKLECSPSHCSLKWHKHWSGRKVEEGGWGGLSTQKQNQKAGGKTETEKGTAGLMRIGSLDNGGIGWVLLQHDAMDQCMCLEYKMDMLKMCCCVSPYWSV